MRRIKNDLFNDGEEDTLEMTDKEFRRAQFWACIWGIFLALGTLWVIGWWL